MVVSFNVLSQNENICFIKSKEKYLKLEIPITCEVLIIILNRWLRFSAYPLVLHVVIEEAFTNF